MWESLETGASLDAVLRLQEMRVGPVNALVEGLHFAGHEIFYIALIGLIYWAINKDVGVRTYFALVAISALTFFFKDLLGRPRPYLVSDAVMPLFTDIGNGIPSGHTAVTLVIWGYLAVVVRRWPVTIAVGIYVLIQGMGRVYAGVHFPQDVVGGLLLGGLTLAAFVPLTGPAANWWNGAPVGLKLALPFGVGLLLAAIYPADEGMVTIAGLLAGSGLGLWLEQRSVQFAHRPEIAVRAGQYVLALVLSLVVMEGLDAAFGEHGVVWLDAGLRFVRYAAVAITALALVPWLSVRVGLMAREET